MRTPILALAALTLLLVSSAQAQQAVQRPAPLDTARARALYVSDDWADHPVTDYAADLADKARTDSIYRTVTRGVVDYQKVEYASRAGGVRIPAYVFQPLQKRGPRGHAAMIWVHGGVHGNWDLGMWPFVREAVERGYVVIAPEYRGSTGYGAEHHNAIDYGGYEVRRRDERVRLAHREPPARGSTARRDDGVEPRGVHHDPRSHARWAPVQGRRGDRARHEPGLPAFLQRSGYQRQFATQQRIQGLPFEKQDVYIERSPLYQVDKLTTPLLVHVATNDEDVDFEEDQMLVYKLRADQTRPHRDEDLRRSGSLGRERRPRVSADGWTARRSSASTRPRSATRGTGPGPSSRSTLRPYEDPNHPYVMRTR
jgi:hypothetical protein